MTSYRNLDSKREEFRKYLEKAGALDALSKVLVMLYDEPEKPADPLDYIIKHLGDSSKPDEAELNMIKAELEECHLKIQTLEDENKLLKERLAQIEPQEGAAMEEGEAGEPSTVAEAVPEGEGEVTQKPPAEEVQSATNASAAGSQPSPQ